MKKFYIALVMLGIFVYAHSQEPVHWTFSSKKIAEGLFEIHLSAAVASPWHTYSQWSPDGGPIPTQIVFIRNPLLILNGKTEEIGHLKTVYDPSFDLTVKYFEGDVEFVQKIKVKTKAKISCAGTIQYMACNDRQCLPPKNIPFTILLQ